MKSTVVPTPTALKTPLALLVDRDEDTRRMYAEYLKLAAYDVEEAGDGREALAKALSRRYDVIVLETHLSGIDGYNLCDLLRHDAVTRTIPIVVVTADAYAADIERAHNVGADVVLVKPCLPETLLAELRQVLAHPEELQRRAAGLREPSGQQIAQAEKAPEWSRAAARRLALSRAHRRGDTSTPPASVPSLVCPECDKPLNYQRSHVGGVSERHPEQWDYFECPAACGVFQYRHRTRKLRKV